MTDTIQMPDVAIRLIEVIAAGRPEAATPKPLGDREWSLFETDQGPVTVSTFEDQDGVKLQIPTRSDAGLRLATGAENRRRAGMRVQSTFNSKYWVIDLRPDDSYDYLKAIAEVCWIRE